MANWSEYIRSRPLVTQPGEPKQASPMMRALLDWESWLTLALVMLVFLSVARSVDRAAWVPEMPSLTSVAFLAILVGFLLAKVHAPQSVLLFAGVVIGVPVVLLLVLQFIQASGLRSGLADVWDRWGAWIDVVRGGGISSDTMPFVSMVITVTWIAGFLCAWAIFKWHNAWLALVPGGFGLMTNISYQPAQSSANLFLFLFGGMLLVMRVHMMRRIDDWQRTNTAYPQFLSLTLLNITTWVALAALALAWWAPKANEVPVLSSAWNRVAGPFGSDSDTFTRLFSSIDSKKDVPLHQFGETLPLQGRVVLSSKIVAQADFGEATNQGRPIRAAVYDEYITGGWRAGSRTESTLAPLEPVAVTSAQPAQFKDRQEIAVSVVTESGTPRRTILGVGAPKTVSINSKAEVANADSIPDIAALRSRRDLKTGDTYITNGTISTASEEKLKAAGTEYPAYVLDRYLQLPPTLPKRVRDLAANLTQGKATPMEKAKAIEEYLRLIPATYEMRSVPPNRDSVDWFLFEEKKGYSDYQASAMVVLLRAAGVPARLAVGYNVEEFDLSVQRYLLRETHAYAWPEVYFPTYGWQEFAPYAEAQVVSRPVSDTSTGDAALNEGDIPRSFGEADFGEIPEDAGGVSSITTPKRNPLKALLPLLGVLLGIIAVGGVAVVGVRFAWERGMKGLDYPSQLWEKLIRLASWLRLGPKPSQTPSEYSRQLQRTLPGTEGVDRVADSYLRSRYGGRREPTTAERDELEQAWGPLRNRMIKRVLRVK